MPQTYDNIRLVEDEDFGFEETVQPHDGSVRRFSFTLFIFCAKSAGGLLSLFALLFWPCLFTPDGVSVLVFLFVLFAFVSLAMFAWLTVIQLFRSRFTPFSIRIHKDCVTITTPTYRLAEPLQNCIWRRGDSTDCVPEGFLYEKTACLLVAVGGSRAVIGVPHFWPCGISKTTRSQLLGLLQRKRGIQFLRSVRPKSAFKRCAFGIIGGQLMGLAIGLTLRDSTIPASELLGIGGLSGLSIAAFWSYCENMCHLPRDSWTTSWSVASAHLSPDRTTHPNPPTSAGGTIASFGTRANRCGRATTASRACDIATSRPVGPERRPDGRRPCRP